MRKDTSKNQSVSVLLSEEQKKALKIDFASLSKRMQERLAKLRGERVSDSPFSKFKSQHANRSA